MSLLCVISFLVLQEPFCEGALERRPSSSDLATSTDDQSSVTGCNASFDTSGDSLGPSGGESSNSGESCTDNTLTSISGVTFSREVASKLNEEAIKQKNKKVENDDDDLDDGICDDQSYSVKSFLSLRRCRET